LVGKLEGITTVENPDVDGMIKLTL